MRIQALPLALTLVCGALSAQQPQPERAVLGVDPGYMDRSVDPCKDFYRYANGTYDREPIPAAYGSFGVNQEIDDRNWALLKGILESAAAATATPGTATQRIGDFYASAMDEAAIEAAGLAPLKPWLERIEGLKGPKDLAPLLAEMHKAGLRAGFGFSVGIDDKDATAMIGQFYQGGLGLPEREYYLRKDAKTVAHRKAYVAHVARMLELSGLKAPAARAGAQRVMALETLMARASRTLEALRDPQKNYHKVARAELAKVGKGFRWEAYFEALGFPAAERNVLVGQPDFLKGFGLLASRGSLGDWKVYLRWHLLNGTASSLPRAFDQANFNFYGRVLSGTQEQLPRWKRMLVATDRAIGFDLGKLYVEKAFSPAAKAKVLEMVAWHKEALRQSIQRAPWMGAATKVQALRKLDSMTAKVGYPDVWRDYSALTVARRPHVLNTMAAKAFEFNRRLAKLGKPVDRTEWLMTPQTNNAYYEPTLNEICLPAGILQAPFFDEKADDASNYGALASTIGHEILHGFDDQGSQYDAQGNLKNWWTPEDRKGYEARTGEVVALYDSFEPLPGLHILGKQTLGENLADIGGLKLSFEAWKLATAGKTLAPADGLSPEQRFFVAFAQGWRTNQRPEEIDTLVKSDVHSPVRERVLGPAKMVGAFQEAFGCKNGKVLELW
ncbi:MAG: M13 family metallopeptidase [Acidobacteria bacterium]|nr:M13 family metallopeptidase [Acidobacteriota bacterium]